MSKTMRDWLREEKGIILREDGSIVFPDGSWTDGPAPERESAETDD